MLFVGRLALGNNTKLLTIAIVADVANYVYAYISTRSVLNNEQPFQDTRSSRLQINL